MPLNLPPATFGFLPGSPLELVVCQIRHDDREVSPEAALAVQEHLGGVDGFFPRIEQAELRVASVSVAQGVASSSENKTFRGWHLKSEDGAWTAAILPGHFSLETTRYTVWGDFKEHLDGLARAVAAAAPPVMEQRIGLRYVDRLGRGLGVESSAGWSKWIQSSVLGPPIHPILGEAVISTRQQVDLDLGDGDMCVLRHGTARDPDSTPEEQSTYLLDFDIYRSVSRRYVPDDIGNTTQAFHDKADALFQQVVTQDLLEHLSREQNV